MIYDENIFNFFLQRNIGFFLDDKLLKKGKLALILQKDYYYIFNLYVDGVLRKVEYPYPFLVHNQNSSILLNYHLTSLGLGNDELYYRYLSLNKIGNSKLYNKSLRIDVID